jgi:flagellar basal body rod protein FlgG
MMNVGDRVKVTSEFPYPQVIPVGTVGVLVSTPHQTKHYTQLYIVTFDNPDQLDGIKQNPFLVDEIEPA